MNVSCLLGRHNSRLVHSRPARSMGDYEWYECKNCDKKLFTLEGNMYGNDKWKNSWHKTPETDKEIYDEYGEIREDFDFKTYYERERE